MIFFLEIVKGKFHPLEIPEMGLFKFQPPSGFGVKTVGLMLYMRVSLSCTCNHSVFRIEVTSNIPFEPSKKI